MLKILLMVAVAEGLAILVAKEAMLQRLAKPALLTRAQAILDPAEPAVAYISAGAAEAAEAAEAVLLFKVKER